MNKITQALTSRTVWTVVVIVLLNTVPALKNMFPSAAWLDSVNGLLTLLAGYFHVNPSQNYTQA
jgi:hypothetical protein